MRTSLIRRAATALLATSFIAVAAVAAGSEWKARLTITLPTEPTAISYSADGNLIAVGHDDGRVTVWETKSGTLVHSLNAHTKKIETVVFTERGDPLVTLGDENRAKIWSTSDWKETGNLEDVAFSLAVSRDGHWLAGQDSQQALWLWDLMTLKRAKQLSKSGVGGAHDMSFTADGRHLVVVYGNDAHFVDVTTGTDVVLPVRTSKPQLNVKQTGNDQFSMSLGALDDNSAMSHSVALSPSGTLVAVGRGWYGKPAFVDVLDIEKQQRVRRYKPKDGGTASSFSSDSLVIAIEGAKNATVWNLADGKQIAVVKGDGLVQFSPRSLELAVTNGNSLILYNPN